MSVEHSDTLPNGFILFLTFLKDYLKCEIFRNRRKCGSYLSKSLPDEGISSTACPLPPPPNSYRLWRLILCVRLSGFKDAQIAGKTRFLKVFLEEISIWIGRLDKEDCLHHCEWASTDLLRVWREQKEGGRVNVLYLLKLGHPSSAFWLWCSWTLDSDWIMSTVFLVVQIANGRRWDFSASIITWANSHNKSTLVCVCVYISRVYIYIYIPLILFLWGTLIHGTIP